jgi:glycosyltransferase involved in cell wall biosynthesis
MGCVDMRQGQNPAKQGLKAYQVKPLGIATLSYIPSQDGFFKQSLEVLEYQIASLHTATTDFDLLVFDNGSCQAVRERLHELHRQGLIHFLFLSQVNIGKIGAINWLLSAMPHDWICYTDGDMFFRPGWFEHSRAIYDAFPSAGLVFAQPTLNDTLRGAAHARHALEGDPRYEVAEALIPEEAVREYALGLGISEKMVKRFLEKPVLTVKEKTSGTRAIMAGAHNQFLLKREVARRIIPLPTQFALSQVEDRAFNQKVDELGYLQLSTLEPYAFHAGNRLDDWTRHEIEVLGLKLDRPASGLRFDRSLPASNSWWKRQVLALIGWLSHARFFESLIRRTYNLLFEFYAK